MTETSLKFARSFANDLRDAFEQPITEVWLGRTTNAREELDVAISLVFASGVFLDPGYYADLTPPVVGQVKEFRLSTNVSSDSNAIKLLGKHIQNVGVVGSAMQVVFELSTNQLFWCETGHDGPEICIESPNAFTEYGYKLNEITWAR